MKTADPASASTFAVGERLQNARRVRGLSQRELARRAGMTNGNLSLIEQGKVSPSITTLEKILAPLQLTLPAFFTDAAPDSSPVVKSQQLTQISTQGVSVALLPLTQSLPARAYTLRQSMAPGAVSRLEFLDRDGPLGGWLAQGRLSLQLDGVDYPVEAGECFTFVSTRNFRLVNPGQESCLIYLSLLCAASADD